MNNPTMFTISFMGNTTNHLSFCVGQSSRKRNRERPYVSRPIWPYQYDHRVKASARSPVNTQIREINSIHNLRTTSQSRQTHIIKKA